MAAKIVLDPGHGGSNPGAVYQGRRESDDALKLAMAVGRVLDENGYDVVYTRTTDTTQSVGQKAAIANEEDADLFVSFHRNAAEYPGQYTGVQTLIYDNNGYKRQMAERINENLADLGFRNAGVSVRPNLVVLNSTKMPALLLEVGFIDSEKDNALLDSRFQAVVQGIADGIMDTLSPQGIPTTRPTPPPPGMPIDPGQVRPMPVLPDTMFPGGSFPVQMLPDDSSPENGNDTPIYYRVQAGAFSNRENAENLLQALLADGLPAFLIYQDGLFKVQIGAFTKLTNAINMERRVRELGYNTYITT